MKNQIATHNEVVLIGRIRHVGSKTKIKGQDVIRVILSVPNDENYDLEPNNISVYFNTAFEKMFRKQKGKAIAVSGHIESKRGMKIICDVMSFI